MSLDIKWDLEKLLYDNYLDELLLNLSDSQNILRLVSYMFTTSRKSENYIRALALGLNEYEITTSEKIYNQTGIYMLKCSMIKKPATLIGSSNMLFKLDTKTLYENHYTLHIGLIGDEGESENSLENNFKFELREIIDNLYLKFEDNILLVDFLRKYSNIINIEYKVRDFSNLFYIHYTFDGYNFDDYKFDYIKLYVRDSYSFVNVKNYSYLSYLKPYFKEIYLMIDEEVLITLINTKTDIGINKLTNYLKENDIKLKAKKENSSLKSLARFLELLD